MSKSRASLLLALNGPYTAARKDLIRKENSSVLERQKLLAQIPRPEECSRRESSGYYTEEERTSLLKPKGNDALENHGIIGTRVNGKILTEGKVGVPHGTKGNGPQCDLKK